MSCKKTKIDAHVQRIAFENFIAAYARYAEHMCDVLGSKSWGYACLSWKLGSGSKMDRYDPRIVGAMGLAPSVAEMFMDGLDVGVALGLAFSGITAASLRIFRTRKVDLQVWCDVEGRFGSNYPA
jgi:hypothetical protein